MPDGAYDKYASAREALLDNACQHCAFDPCRCTDCFDCCRTLAPDEVHALPGRLLCETCFGRAVEALRATESVRVAS